MQEVAVATAAFGMLVSGLVGAPLARRLILANDLAPKDGVALDEDPETPEPVSLDAVLGVLLQVTISVAAAQWVGADLRAAGVTLPDFVLALGFAAVVGNVANALGVRTNASTVRLIGDVSLQVFVAVTLVALKFWVLADTADPILLVMACQAALVCAFVYWIVFPALGRDYDAAVASAGVIGFALGVTAVGLANMRAITHRYETSPQAYLVVPIVGAFLIDFVNTALIQLYISVEILG